MTGFDRDLLDRAHRHCMRNREEIEKSSVCGCFYCLATFPAKEVDEWTDDQQTALCPKCGIDSVLAGLPNVPAADAEFLTAMRIRWF
jgi:NAD-dependent SIR2 family protein deacetylase